MNIPEFVSKEIEAAKVWKKRIELKRQYMKVLTDTPDGRDVLHDILRAAMFSSNCFDANPNVAAYNEGKRFVALHILSRLRMNNEEANLKLLEEGYER